MTFEFFADDQGRYRWRLRHASGEVLADAPHGFASLDEAMRCVAYVRSSSSAAIEGVER